MIRFRNFVSLVVLLVGVAILGAPTRAHADFQIDITDSSGTTTVFFAPGVVGLPSQGGFYTGLSPNLEFNITFLTSIVTQANVQTQLTISDLRIERLVAGSGTLTLSVGANNLTLPPGTPLAWSSGAGGSYAPQPGIPPLLGAGSAALTFQSYADNTNTLLGTQQTLNAQPGDPPSSTVPMTFNTDEATGLFNKAPNATYSLRSDVTITLDNNSAAVPLVFDGSIVGFQGHNIVSTVPAPPGLLLALSGLPVLGVGHWLRRRKSQAV